MWHEWEMKIHAPEIGRAWYNTAPLAMRELGGEESAFSSTHQTTGGTDTMDLL